MPEEKREWITNEREPGAGHFETDEEYERRKRTEKALDELEKKIKPAEEENTRIELSEVREALKDESAYKRIEGKIDDMVEEIRGEEYVLRTNPSGVFLNCIKKTETVENLADCVGERKELADVMVLGAIVDGVREGMEEFRAKEIVKEIPTISEEAAAEQQAKILKGFIKGAFRDE